MLRAAIAHCDHKVANYRVLLDHEHAVTIAASWIADTQRQRKQPRTPTPPAPPRRPPHQRTGPSQSRAGGLGDDEAVALRQVVSSSVQTGVVGASPLSAAELRLLPYMQTHHTIGDIAQRLYVSRNTVNSQVSSIYRKLGVSSRDEAVQRGTAIGLLGG